MKITKESTFHCFFEQSGTFKNEFKKLGYNAIDYDILNDYGETDVQIDLFAEIDKAYGGGQSVLDNVSPGEYILAFFPCTYFQCYNQLIFNGQTYNLKTWSKLDVLKSNIKRHKELSKNYEAISKLAYVCIERNIPLIIENPATQPHYLNLYWCIKPKFIDEDRRERGDLMKKPTQYWFINCEPKNNFIFEPQIHRETKTIDTIVKSIKTRARDRSEIAPEYANRFIREFILDGDCYGC